MKVGKTLELEHPQYFVDGRGSLQAKKDAKIFGVAVAENGV